jgi:curved DNA-binding protein CbpA
MADKNFYDVLQVSRDAEPEVIDAAYKRLAFKYHPDRNPNASDERIREIIEAYEILRFPLSRNKYDESLRATEEYSDTGSPISSSSEWFSQFKSVIAELWIQCDKEAVRAIAGVVGVLVLGFGFYSCRNQPKAPASLTGFESMWDRGVFTYDLLLTNKSAGNLSDVNLAVNLINESGQSLEVKRFWASWEVNETKRINVPADSYQMHFWHGTAFRDGELVTIDLKWTSRISQE